MLTNKVLKTNRNRGSSVFKSKTAEYCIKICEDEKNLICRSFFLAARDVVASLAEDGVNDPKDFNWIAQMRYYWEENVVMVRMISTTVPYDCEYLGNSTRLVITPLTERCYRCHIILIVVHDFCTTIC